MNQSALYDEIAFGSCMGFAGQGPFSIYHLRSRMNDGISEWEQTLHM